LDHRLYEYWLFSSTPSSPIERFANGYPQPEDILAEPEEKLPFGALGEVLGPKVKIEDRNPEAHVLLDKYIGCEDDHLCLFQPDGRPEMKLLTTQVVYPLTYSNQVGQRA
jgi:hypothetical protein